MLVETKKTRSFWLRFFSLSISCARLNLAKCELRDIKLLLTEVILAY